MSRDFSVLYFVLGNVPAVDSRGNGNTRRHHVFWFEKRRAMVVRKRLRGGIVAGAGAGGAGEGLRGEP